MSQITDEVIRKLDAHYIASLIADKDSQRKEIDLLHQTIGCLEWKLEDRESQIKHLTQQLESLSRCIRTGTP